MRRFEFSPNALRHQFATANRNSRTVAGAALRRKRGAFAQQMRQVAPKMNIPELAHFEGIWAISMVKDEADIIGATINHLVGQGVTHFLIMDNGSTDGTSEVLRELQPSIPGLFIGHDHEPAHYQAAKMTLLADAARKAGATWVIPFDADEFWYGANASVAETLDTCHTPICAATMHNIYPQPDGQLAIDDQAQLLEKVAFRPTRTSTLSEGNHSVARPGDWSEDLRIAHHGWRSFEQFARKLRNGARALELTDLSAETGDHWRMGGKLSDDQLALLWKKLEAGNLPEMGWTPVGRLTSLPKHMGTKWSETGLR